jgi:hypothetical protein
VPVTDEFIGISATPFGVDTDVRGVAEIVFSDGVLWDKPDISFAVAHPEPADAVILGTPDRDVLDPGIGGGNTLSGGDGGDALSLRPRLRRGRRRSLAGHPFRERVGANESRRSETSNSSFLLSKSNCKESFDFFYCSAFSVPDECLAWLDGCNRSRGNEGCTARACIAYKPSFRCLQTR